MLSLEKSQLESACLMAFLWIFFFNKETDKSECDLLWLMQAAGKNAGFYEKLHGYIKIFQFLAVSVP